MRRLVIGVTAFLAVAAGLAAAAGRTQWGHWGWYYHFGPEYRLRVGLAAMQRGDLYRADRIIDNLSESGYSDHAALLQGEVLYREGIVLADNNQVAQFTKTLTRAVEELNKVPQESPHHLRAVTLQGLCFVRLGKPDDVAHTLEYVLGKDPDNADAYRGLAVLYQDQGAHITALYYLEHVAELDPTDGRPQRLMGLIYKDYERYGEAVEAYREALRRKLLDLRPEPVRKELAECLVKLGKHAEALEVLGQFEPLPADVAAVAALRAECLNALGRTAEAQSTLDAALGEFPTTIPLLVQRAKLHVAANEPDRAAKLLEKAIALDRHDYDAHYQLVLAYRALNRVAEAQTQEKAAEAIKSDLAEFSKLYKEAGDKPWDRDVRLKLAEVCTRLEKHRDAAIWRQAAAACPSPQDSGKKEDKKTTG